MLVDPKSVKKIDNLTVFFTLLGSVSVKAVRRMLMKLSPDVGTCSGLPRLLASILASLFDRHATLSHQTCKGPFK